MKALKILIFYSNGSKKFYSFRYMLYICRVIEKDITYKAYEYFYKHFVDNSSYKVKITDRFSSTINKFLLNHKENDINFLYEYLLVAFNYCLSNSIKKGYVTPSTIFGGKIQEQYSKYLELKYSLKQTEKNLLIIKDEFVEYINRKKSENISAYQNVERRRFLNTDYGFLHCQTLTSGYKENNKYCKQCKFAELCKEIKGKK